jgi:hypothetical protein
MIPRRELDPLVLRVVGLEIMLRFYCGVLGCTVDRRADGIGLVQVRAGRSLERRNGAEGVGPSIDIMDPEGTRPLFLFVGADPNTGWLAGCPIELDTHGFECTGHAMAKAALVAGGWHDGDRPDSLECSLPGVFAIGDVRAESAKCKASAVGQGEAVIEQVHRFLSAQLASVSASAQTLAALTASGPASAAVGVVPPA